MTAILNIGLNVGDTPTWDLNDVVIAVYAAAPTGTFITRAEVRQSSTEQTAILQLSTLLTPAEADMICFTLKQDCIAQFAGGVGRLYGPKAAEWGPFNPEYFLEFDDATA